MKDDATRIRRPIPENYATGINVLGFNFKTRNAIEGIMLALIFAAVGALVFFQFDFIDIGTKIGFIISFGAIGLVLGLIGINDEPISVFVGNKLAFRRRKRTAFYNPRIKSEAIPYVFEYRDAKDRLPKEKIIAFYRKYKADIEKREQERMLEFQATNTFDETSMFFKDDEGIVDKPVEYMNSSEYKSYMKKVRKKEKEARRAEKKAEKLAKKEEKLRLKQAKKEEKANKKLAAEEEKARKKLAVLESRRESMKQKGEEHGAIQEEQGRNTEEE